MNSEKTIQIFEANADLRTWVQTTKPYWTQEDHDHFNLNKRQSLNHACARRARPAMCARGLAPVRSVQARPVGVAPQSNARFCLKRRPKLRRRRSRRWSLGLERTCQKQARIQRPPSTNAWAFDRTPESARPFMMFWLRQLGLESLPWLAPSSRCLTFTRNRPARKLQP